MISDIGQVFYEIALCALGIAVMVDIELFFGDKIRKHPQRVVAVFFFVLAIVIVLGISPMFVVPVAY
jgi:hypothetical protein